jgi:hypothetical protein
MASNRTLQSNRPDHCLQTRSLRCGLSSGARLRVSPAALRQRDQDGGCLLRVGSGNWRTAAFEAGILKGDSLWPATTGRSASSPKAIITRNGPTLVGKLRGDPGTAREVSLQQNPRQRHVRK